MNKKKVLMTGHAGLIGRVVSDSLSEKYDFSYLDRQKVNDSDFIADISKEIDKILPAFENQEVVVHLAGDSHRDDPWENIFPNNIVGTYNVFEAARIAGVKRIVFASSVRATDMNQLDEIPAGFRGGWKELWDRFSKTPSKILEPEDPVRPYNIYGVSKVFGEALGRYYSDRFGISVICLRIGGFQDNDMPSYEYIRRVWLSWRDGISGFDKAISAPENVKFGIFYLTSNNKQNVYDLSNTKKVLGYDPKDNSDDYPVME